MLSIALKMLGVGRAIFKAITQFASNYPWQSALVLSLAFSAWCWHGWNGAIDERDAIRLDLDAIKVAQSEAGRQAKAHREQDERNTAIIAERHEHELAETRAELRSALARYAATNRVRQAAGSASGGTPAGTVPDDPARADGQPSDPVMVAVSETDLNDLAEGAVQAAVWRQLGQELIDTGYAVLGE